MELPYPLLALNTLDRYIYSIVALGNHFVKAYTLLQWHWANSDEVCVTAWQSESEIQCWWLAGLYVAIVLVHSSSTQSSTVCVSYYCPPSTAACREALAPGSVLSTGRRASRQRTDSISQSSRIWQSPGPIPLQGSVISLSPTSTLILSLLSYLSPLRTDSFPFRRTLFFHERPENSVSFSLPSPSHTLVYSSIQPLFIRCQGLIFCSFPVAVMTALLLT